MSKKSKGTKAQSSMGMAGMDMSDFYDTSLIKSKPRTIKVGSTKSGKDYSGRGAKGAR